MKIQYVYFDNLIAYNTTIYKFAKRLNIAFTPYNIFVNLIYQTTKFFLPQLQQFKSTTTAQYNNTKLALNYYLNKKKIRNVCFDNFRPFYIFLFQKQIKYFVFLNTYSKYFSTLICHSVIINYMIKGHFKFFYFIKYYFNFKYNHLNVCV